MIRCGEKGRSWGERGVFDGKNISDREFFLPAEVSEELVLPVDMEKFLVKTDSADYTYIITAVDILPEAEGELIVDRSICRCFIQKKDWRAAGSV